MDKKTIILHPSQPVLGVTQGTYAGLLVELSEENMISITGGELVELSEENSNSITTDSPSRPIEARQVIPIDEVLGDLSD